MELNVYDVIKGPVVSSKAQKLNKTQKQLVLEVHVDATKPMISRALKDLFNVVAEDVRTSVRKFRAPRGVKRRSVGASKMKKIKIAYISLAEGYALNLLEQAGGPDIQQASTAA